MPLEDVLVSIHQHQTGKRVGAGFLVENDLVLTCAHVANASLGRPLAQSGRPKIPIALALHSDPEKQIVASIDDGPDAWSDPPATAKPGADLCLLRLPKPTNYKKTKLCMPDTLILREFRAAGFPQDWNGDLDIATGEILGRDEYGLYLLRPKSAALAAYIMARGHAWTNEQRTAGLVYSGFSGGPVEVGDMIVGIISEARAIPSNVTAYMIAASSFPERISTPIFNLQFKAAGKSGFISQLAPGPMVKETYFVTRKIVETYARLAATHVEAHTIVANANRLRAEADPSEDKSDIAMIEVYMLPNFDKGAFAFWHDCLMRACTMGPRILAALLVELPDESLDQDAKRDQRDLLKLLFARYKNDLPRVP